MKTRWPRILLALVVATGLVGCTGSSRPKDTVSEPPLASAFGAVGGWDVFVTVAPSMPASTMTIAHVKAVNSSDTTLSNEPLLYIEMRDSEGELVPRGYQARSALPILDKGPGSTFEYDPGFTVPPPGRYTIGVAGMRDSSNNPVGALFTSVPRTFASASGTVGGWDVVVTVDASLPAGTTKAARIKAVNSSDTTLSNEPLLYIEIRDSEGELLPRTAGRGVIEVQDKAPGSTFEYYRGFTVPPPGGYTVGVAGMRDSRNYPVGAAFTSFRR